MWAKSDVEFVLNYTRRFKEEIISIVLYSQYIHELAKAYQRHLPIYRRRIIKVPFGKIDVGAFIRGTVQANEDLRNKIIPRCVGHPTQESNLSQEKEGPEYKLRSEEDEGSSFTPMPKRKKVKRMTGHKYRMKFM